MNNDDWEVKEFPGYFPNFVVLKFIWCKKRIILKPMIRSGYLSLAMAGLLWLSLSAGTFAQPAMEKADSLFRTMAMEDLPDSVKTDTLISLCRELRNNQPETAFEYGQQAIGMANDLGNSLQIGRAYMAVAEIYVRWSYYEQSLEYLFNALNAFESAGSSEDIASCCDNIGEVYMNADEYQEATTYYQRAYALNLGLRNPAQTVRNLIHFGTNYLQQDSIDLGLTYFLPAMRIADSLNMTEEMLSIRNHIGQGFSRLGDYEMAVQYYYNALDTLENHPDEYYHALTLTNMAAANFNLGLNPQSRDYASQALGIAEKYSFNELIERSTKILSDVYARQGNYQRAFRFLQQNRMISDTIRQKENDDELIRIRFQYELDQRDKENALLSAANERARRSIQTRTIIISAIVSLVAVLIALIYVLVSLNNKYRNLNEKLFRQGKELEDLNEQKDRFFSFVAHNLKNPFNTIMGFAELMQRSTDERDLEKGKQYAGLIYNLSSQVQKVLSNLLEWSRLQRRTFECKPETIELNSLIKDVLEMNNKEAARKDLHFELLDHENVYAFADRTMITTVLQNLISNAINFTQPSGKISFRCGKDGDKAVVSVIDNGVGLSEEDISRLFQFELLKTKVGSGDNRGAGLGLIICREMLHRNDGEISVTSKQDKGSTFTFTLPLAIRNDTEKFATSENGFGEAQRIMDELLNGENLPPTVDAADILQTLTPVFEEVTGVLSLDNLEAFARVVTETGERHSLPLLATYGTIMGKLTRMHQIDQLIKLLPRFREFLSFLETKS